MTEWRVRLIVESRVNTPWRKHRKGEILTLEVEDLAFGGEGVARPWTATWSSSPAAFPAIGFRSDRPGPAPLRTGDDRGRGASLARSGRAPVPIFGRCGGCRLQHVRYEAQLEFKERQVRECLARLGGVGPARVRPIIGAPELYGYRNKMEFTFAEADGQASWGSTRRSATTRSSTSSGASSSPTR